MQQTNVPATDAAIIGRLGEADKSDFSPEAAREILSLQLSPKDQKRMHKLSLKAQEGALTPRRTERGGELSTCGISAWHPVVQGKALLEARRHGRNARKRPVSDRSDDGPKQRVPCRTQSHRPLRTGLSLEHFATFCLNPSCPSRPPCVRFWLLALLR